MTIQRKTYGAAASEIGPRTVRVICSTDTVDRMGEVIEQAGIGLADFQANPIILWSHNPEHPVGTARSVSIIEGQLEAEIEFAPEGLSPKADEICALVKAGIVKTISIGFDPIDTIPMDPTKPKGPQRYKQIQLLEISFVSIPANPDAQVVERSAGSTEEPTMTTKTKQFRTKVLGAPTAKGLYQIGALARVLGDLGWIQDDVEWEADIEKDDSALPAILGQIMADLGAALIALTQEEVAEMLADLKTDQPDVDILDGIDDDDAAYVTAGATLLQKRFRAGIVRARSGAAPIAPVTKAGKKISAKTAASLQSAVEIHQKAMTMHEDACAIITKLMGDADQEDNSESGTAAGDEIDPAESTAEKGQDAAAAKSLDLRKRQIDLLSLATH